MNPSQIVPAMYDFIQSILRIVWLRHRIILDVLILAVALTVGWMLWSESSPEVVIYVGPQDSSSSRAGAKVVDELRHTKSPSGSFYRVRMEYTNGVTDIRQRLETSGDGISLGFLSDVENRQTALSVLLPLDWDYLHVMCRIGFLREIESRSGKIPDSLDQVLGYVKRDNSVFVGPPGSNSAELAEIVLDQYGVGFDSELATGIEDWDGLRRAFKSKQIDLAFYCGPLGASNTNKIASDKTVALIGVGPIEKAIIKQANTAIAPAVLPQNLARAAVEPAVPTKDTPGMDTGEVSSPPQPIPFCGTDRGTLAIRRYLVCARKLSTADAYLLAKAARQALDGDYQINLKMDNPPYVKEVETPAHMKLHPGTELLSKNTPLRLWRDPETWPSWLQFMMLGLAITVGIELLRKLQKRLDQLAGIVSPGSSIPPAAAAVDTAPTPPATDDGYVSLKQRIEACEAELEQQSYVESDAKLTDWNERIRELREAIRASKTLTDEQRDSLDRGVLSLRVDLMLLRREPTTSPKRSRAKPAAAPVKSAATQTDEAEAGQ